MAEATPVKKLSELFTDTWKLYNELEDSTEPTASSSYQTKVGKAVEECGHLIEIVNELNLYSTNEDIEEVATKDLKFMLLHALLGKLHMKKTIKERSERPAILSVSEVEFKHFLQTCFDYGVGPLSEIKHILSYKASTDDDGYISKPVLDSTGKPDLKVMSDTRDEKIRKYKEAKERKAEILRLSGQEETLDEDTLRNFWKLQMNQWIRDTLDDLKSIRDEQKMLKHMERLSLGTGSNQAPKPVARPPGFKPFMLTRDNLQAHVFGAGYPSLPTVTLDEFYEREAAKGRFPDSGNGVPQGGPSSGQVESEDSDDDDEKVYKKREMDEFKDGHRRGDGNRYRKG